MYCLIITCFINLVERLKKIAQIFIGLRRCCCAIILFLVTTSLVAVTSIASPEGFDEDDIEIVEGKDKTVYEYRQNGVLMMIKVVPKIGKPYYMVPADGAPHFETLDHKKKLYPQWVLIEW